MNELPQFLSGQQHVKGTTIVGNLYIWRGEDSGKMLWEGKASFVKFLLDISRDKQLKCLRGCNVNDGWINMGVTDLDYIFSLHGFTEMRKHLDYKEYKLFSGTQRENNNANSAEKHWLLILFL